MTNEEKMQVLREWEKRSKELYRQLEAFANLTGASSESPLLDAGWKSFDHHMESVSRLVKCDSNDLSWYCFENDFGEKELPAAYKGVVKPIRTVEDLAWMLGIGEEQRHG